MLTRECWGELEPDGRPVERFEVASSRVTLAVLTYGATVQSLLTPDRDGALDDIVLGFEGLDSYLGDHPFVGGTIGRHANRIAGARFTLDGTTYRVPANDGPHALHGGPDGYHRRIWDVHDWGQLRDGGWVELGLVDPGGTMGYPGTVVVRQRVSVSGAEVRWDTTATTTAPTVISLTGHAYLALQGSRGDILNQRVRIPAERFLPVGPDGIPLDHAPAPVDQTVFDLRRGATLADSFATGQLPRGFDHYFAVGGLGLRPMAHVREPTTGRTLTVHSTEPGLQFYTGGYLDGSLTGKKGHRLSARAALCLETHGYPDAPNRPDFPSPVLRPGETFTSTTVWELGAG